MTNLVWIFLLVLILTLLGSGILLFVTVKYYWGERGRPPLTGEERRRQYEEEMKLRAERIEYNRRHPVKPRSGSFWDNTKQV